MPVSAISVILAIEGWIDRGRERRVVMNEVLATADCGSRLDRWDRRTAARRREFFVNL